MVVVVSKNDTFNERTATISIIAGAIQKTVTVTQKCKDTIIVEDNEHMLEAEESILELPLQSNVDVTVNIPTADQSWIKLTSVRSLTEKKLSFDIKANTTGKIRKSIITISGGNVTQEISIIQNFSIPSNQIWYKTSDGNIYNLSSKSGFGAKYLKNEYNPETGYWAISFDGDVTNLPYHALNSIKITEVILPNKLISIEGSAFVGCDLDEITIPESVTTFGECIFNNCSIRKIKSKFASSDNRCLIKDGKIIAFASKGIEAYTVPPAAHTIEKYAFYCATIKSIVIGNNITTINAYAFGSSALESIQWPSNVEAIPYGAFNNCYNLQNITIPSTVNSIGQYAFYRCTKLKTLTLPSSILTIGNNAFDHASIITLNVEGNLPSTNHYYPYLYFATIENIIIGDSAISIGDNALKNCLCTNLTIGEKVSVIGEYALPLNNSLVNIYSKATTPPKLAEQSRIDYAQNLAKIYVPNTFVDAYKTADGWKDFAEIIVGYDF